MKTKQEKALDLLQAFEETDESLVQQAMYVDSPEQFVALGGADRAGNHTSNRV